MKKTYPVRNPDVVSRKEEKEALLFNPSDGNMMCINRTGIMVWDLSDGKHSVSEIAGKITETYEVEAGIAENDCKTYVAELEKAGFLGFKA